MTEIPDALDLSWTIGDVTIQRVEESIIPLATKVLVPDVTLDHIEANRPWVDPFFADPVEGRPMMRLSIHSFVVRSEGRTIVVDTCVGPDPERSLPGDAGFADRLDAALDGGLASVDVVVCTHLHFDHVGWNTRTVDGRVVPTFPNARYLVTRAEMDQVDEDDHMEVRVPSILPLAEAGVLDIIDLGPDNIDPDGGTSDGGAQRGAQHAITGEVGLVSTPGHTDGHVSVLIRSGGAEALITGDAFHTPLQFAHPELAAWRFDRDSELSTATRRSLIDRYAGTDALVLGTHFAPPTAGRLVRHQGGVRFDS